MKYSFFHLIWFLFLDKEQKEKLNTTDLQLLRKHIPLSFNKADFNNEDVIKDFLFMTSYMSLGGISHRRNKIFSFNPRTRDDYLYLVYIENYKDIADLSYIQRILLSRVVFNLKTKTATFENKDLEKIQNPIVIEVNNV